MDLALALVEEDLGPRAALAVARRLVLFVRRPGGQAQFSAGLAAQAAVQAPLRELQPGSPTISPTTSACPRSRPARR